MLFLYTLYTCLKTSGEHSLVATLQQRDLSGMYRRTACTIIKETINEENEKSKTEGMARPEEPQHASCGIDRPRYGLRNRSSEKRFTALGDDVFPQRRFRKLNSSVILLAW